MKVKDFFTIETPQANKPAPQHISKNYSESMSRRRQTTVTPVKRMFTVNVHVEKPDIILLEDMDDINSNCIILNVIYAYAYKNLIFTTILYILCST